MNIRLYGLLGIWFLCAGKLTCFGQTTYVDSLKTSLRQATINDTIRMEAIAQIVNNTASGTKEKDYYIGELWKIASKGLQTKNLSEAMLYNYRYYLGLHYFNKAYESSLKGDRHTLSYYNKGISIYTSIEDFEQVNIIYVNMAAYLMKLQRFDEAFQYYFKALRYFESVKDASGMSAIYQDLGCAYQEMSQDGNAIKYFKKALDYFKDPKNCRTFDDRNRKLVILSNMGAAYASIGAYTDSEKYLEEALALAEINKDNRRISLTLSRLGHALSKLKKDDAAKKVLQRAIALAVDDESQALAYAGMGQHYLKLHNYGDAIKNLEVAKRCAERIKYADLREVAAINLYRAYKGDRQFEKSLAAHESYVAIKDSSKLEASRNQLEQQQLKHVFERKELEAKAAHERKLADVRLAAAKEKAHRDNLLYIAVAVGLILVSGLLFLYFYTKQRNRYKNDELQQKLLLSQMNPHFIFNAVDNIQSLIYKKKDQDAISYLSKFSKLTRQILENSRESHILLSEEVQMLENYLSIQLLLYSNTFGYTITVAPEIDTDDILIPPMLTQPFVENAILHGIKDRESGGTVAIRYYLLDKRLYFEVTDNGKGLQTTEKKGYKSMSSQITKERLDSISKNKMITIETKTIADTEGKPLGVKTCFEIPYTSVT